jgi:hypothetical protein
MVLSAVDAVSTAYKRIAFIKEIDKDNYVGSVILSFQPMRFHLIMLYYLMIMVR